MSHDPLAGFLRQQDVGERIKRVRDAGETLKAALEARIAADEKKLAIAIEAEIAAEREENQRLRQVAIKALEKQAKSGDTTAAVELFRLVS